jgi:uncharacterized membrane protein
MGSSLGSFDMGFLAHSAKKRAAPRLVALLACTTGALLLAGCDFFKKEEAEAPQIQTSAPSVAPTPLEGAPADDATRAQYAKGFNAYGLEEPFWTVEVTEGWATFTRPGLESVEGSPTQTVTTAGASVKFADAELRLSAKACTDSTGRSLPFTAQVYYDGGVYSGCAQQGAGVGSGDWTAFVPEMLPAIDACLARTAQKPVQVSFAYQADEEGGVAVRLRDAEGGRYECVAAADGSEVSSYEGLLDTDVLDQEGRVTFTRRPDAPPPTSCPPTPLKAANGSVVGTVTRRTCG